MEPEQILPAIPIDVVEKVRFWLSNPSSDRLEIPLAKPVPVTQQEEFMEQVVERLYFTWHKYIDENGTLRKAAVDQYKRTIFPK